MKRIWLIFIVVFSLSAVFAQKPKAIDAARLLKDVEILAADDMEGRGIASPGGKKAREYVEKRFLESGVRPFKGSFSQPFDFKGRKDEKIEGVNIVGYVDGSKFKEKYIVVSAHYDHVGIEDGEIFNGADDNASGTAALFAIARYFSKRPPAHTIIFAAFDAEESGLRGSRAFVAAPPVLLEKIVLNINMDMVSRNDKGELYASGTYHYPQLKPMLEKVGRKAKVKLLLGHDRPEQGRDDWTRQSDHGSFHAANIPFIYFGVEDHKDYHQPTDDFANIQPDFYARAVETILDAVKGLDKKMKQPKR